MTPIILAEDHVWLPEIVFLRSIKIYRNQDQFYHVNRIVDKIMKVANLFIAFVVTSVNSFSQNGTILGYVSDEQSHSPLQGATIILPGKSSGDNSDNFGMFKFKSVAPGYCELLLSHIGYTSEKVIVDVKENYCSVVKINMRQGSLNLSSVDIPVRRTSVLTTIAAVDIKLRPINTSQDILRIVPGLFIAQHAGGGKAEQIFLRGYDADHGTDINVSADGVPVNMVSHAHGQGYADLHFLIPETVDKINFDKGPYFTNKGNLATAGYVELQTKDFLQNNQVKFQTGQFNTQRMVGMFKLFNRETENIRQQFYVATEYFRSDGYFDASQDFHRFNTTAKYTSIFNNNTKLTIIGSILDSKWNASGQIPERAVKKGVISRFGSIDNSEGGNTNRENLSARLNQNLKNGWQLTNQVYFINYHFNLYSDFTFFLKDSVNGDEINQRETRNIYGYTGNMLKDFLIGNKNANIESGWGFRYDDIDHIELNHVVKRRFLDPIQLGDVHEMNLFAYANQNTQLTDKLNMNAGLRYDFFKFSYKNILAGGNAFESQTRGTVSPKLNFNYSLTPSVKIYLNTGIGFHSNDTRVILSKAAKNILPKVFGTDLGFMMKPVKNLIIKTALWQLYSQQEFVYAGDEGIVEPGGRTRRIGIDASIRYQLFKWLYADLDFDYAKPRSVDAPKRNNYVPLAPTFTTIGGFTMKFIKGFNGSLRYRYMGTRPANEDNTTRAEGYFLLDAVISYSRKKFEFSSSMENILNCYWKEAQFDTESRLQSEPAPVSEIHYTPGTPRFLKMSIAFNF